MARTGQRQARGRPEAGMIEEASAGKEVVQKRPTIFRNAQPLKHSPSSLVKTTFNFKNPCNALLKGGFLITPPFSPS